MASTRCAVARCATPPDRGSAQVIQRRRYALLQRPWNLSRREQHKLADSQANNNQLSRARLLNDALADSLEYRQSKRARAVLDECCR